MSRYFLGIIATIAALVFIAPNNTVLAQYGYRFGDSSSLGGQPTQLIPREGYGPFGKRYLGGPMIRDYSNSRFSMNGALYDERGNWIGISGSSPTSRFKRYWEDPEFQFYRSDAYQSRPRPTAQDLGNDTYYSQFGGAGNTPQLSSNDRYYSPATPPPSNMIAEQLQNEGPQIKQPPREVLQRSDEPLGPRMPKMSAPPTEQWMRGGTSRNNAGQAAGNAVSRNNRNAAYSQGDNGITRSGVRAVGTEPFDPNVIPRSMGNLSPALPPPQLTPQQIAAAKREALTRFQSHLEEMVLSSPDVHLLSEVQVQFDSATGTATLRGVVPSEQSKVKAGEILLTIPEVKRVKNVMSIVK